MKRITIAILFCCLCINFYAQKDSLYKNFNKNGKLSSEGRKINGMKEGEWKYYDDSTGYLRRVINFKNDLNHGIYTEFYKNGKVKTRGYYDRNFMEEKIIEGGYKVGYANRIGSWDYFDDKGNLIKTEVHDCSGEIIKVLPEN